MTTDGVHLDETACAVAGAVPCRGCGSQSGAECADNGYVPKAHNENERTVAVQCNYCDVIAVLHYNAAHTQAYESHHGTVYLVTSGERLVESKWENGNAPVGMTDHTEAERLAEIEAHSLRALAEAWADEHYLHDSVGAFESGWEARQSVIDSLAAERDRLAAAGCPRCGHALRNEQDHALGSPCPMCGCMSTGGSDGAEAWRIRAEAAEADRERLREVLDRVLSSFKRALAGGVIRDADEVIAEAEAALATPPSEGGQS